MVGRLQSPREVVSGVLGWGSQWEVERKRNTPGISGTRAFAVRQALF